MRSDLDGEHVDAAIRRYLTDAQIAELGALFAGLVADVAARRAERLGARSLDSDDPARPTNSTAHG